MDDSKSKTRITAEEQTFRRLCDTVGLQVALYCLCAVSDLPYLSGAVAESWRGYQELLAVKELTDAGFSAGETDASRAALEGAEPGRRWVTVWGDEYSESDYVRLDDLYKTMTSQLDVVGGTIDKQQEDCARLCSRMALLRDKCVVAGDKESIEKAAKLDKMIRDNLKDCNMRKADAEQPPQQTLDDFVKKLQARTGLTMEMTRDEVMQAFFDWTRSGKYEITVDAAEHILYSILRTMAKNDDLPEPQTLPKGFKMQEYSLEFADEPNEQEKEVYSYLGLIRDVNDAGGRAPKEK